MNSPVRSLIARGAPSLLGTRGKSRLAILNYHRVVGRPDPMRPREPTPEHFHWQMQLLARHFHPLSLAEALSRLWEGTLPERAVCVTFDDGYADNATVALPILEACGVPATIFIATGFLDGGLMWNDAVIEFARAAAPGRYPLGEGEIHLEDGGESRRRAAGEAIRALKHLSFDARQAAIEDLAAGDTPLPRSLMLDSGQLRKLGGHPLITLGAHTVNHPILEVVDDAVAAREITESREQLAVLSGQEVNFFAYPNGKPGQDYSERHRRMVEAAGFSAALSTRWGVATPASDRYQLPRFTPWDRQPLKFMLRLLLNYRKPV